MNGGSNDFRCSCIQISVTVYIQLKRLQQNIKQIYLLRRGRMNWIRLYW